MMPGCGTGIALLPQRPGTDYQMRNLCFSGAESRETVTTDTMLELSDGSVALIDQEDVGRVANYEWRLPASHGSRFAIGKQCSTHELCEVVFLHRLIANAGPDDVVLHRNRNTLDNRRDNLVVLGRQSSPLGVLAQSVELWAD
jgi:hypothetical protein